MFKQLIRLKLQVTPWAEGLGGVSTPPPCAHSVPQTEKP